MSDFQLSEMGQTAMAALSRDQQWSVAAALVLTDVSKNGNVDEETRVACREVLEKANPAVLMAVLGTMLELRAYNLDKAAGDTPGTEATTWNV